MQYSSHVQASSNCQPPAPWVVTESSSHAGRFYFMNSETHESVWTLPRWDESEAGIRADFSPRSPPSFPLTNSQSIRQSSSSSSSISPAADVVDTNRQQQQSSTLDRSQSNSRVAPSSTFDVSLPSIFASRRSSNASTDRGSLRLRKAASYAEPRSSSSSSSSLGGSSLSGLRLSISDGDLQNLAAAPSVVTPSPPSRGSGLSVSSAMGWKRKSVAAINFMRGAAGAATTTTTVGDTVPTTVAVSEKTATAHLGASQQQEADGMPKSASDLVVVRGLGKGGYGVVVEVVVATGASLGGGGRKEEDDDEGEEDDEGGKQRRRFAMKCVRKSKYARSKAKRGLRREVQILTEVAPSRFLLRAHLAFQTETSLFLVTDLLAGGDLFFHLDKLLGRGKGGFPEAQVRVLLSEVVLGVVHLHDRGFLHLDLKVENVMLDHAGHVKLIDFGLAMEFNNNKAKNKNNHDNDNNHEDEEEGVAVEDHGFLTNMAPEMLKPEERGGRFSDWWGVGLLVYVLLAGAPPWSTNNNNNKGGCGNGDGNSEDDNEAHIFKDIKSMNVRPPRGASRAGGDFVTGLLQKDRRRRLGTKNDREVLGAPFFAGIDWAAAERGETAPAFVPSKTTTKKTKKKGVLCVRSKDAKLALEEYGKLLSKAAAAAAASATSEADAELFRSFAGFEVYFRPVAAAPPMASAFSSL